MRCLSGRLFFAGLLAYLLIPAHAAFAAGNLQATLAQLDAAAARFHSTTANFEFKSVQTEPVPDTEIQKGVVYYRREGSTFHMGIHINSVDGAPAERIIVCCEEGTVQLYDARLNQVTRLSKLSQYESWFMLGFGASGKDLAQKWEITDDGPETVDGVKTEKLELVAKDPAVRRNIAKVTLWMNLETGVSLRQRFDEDPSHYRIATYTNIKMNESQPRDAFSFKTNKQTAIVTR